MAAVSVMAASMVNAPTPMAKRKACRRRSRPSCTSTDNNSSRFSAMANNRLATSLQAAGSCLMPTVDASIIKSIALASAGDKITDDRPQPEGNGHGVIGMLMHGRVGRFGSGDRFVPDPSRHFLGAFHCGGETFAGFPNFFPADIGGGVDQGFRVFGQCAHVRTCICRIVHNFL